MYHIQLDALVREDPNFLSPDDFTRIEGHFQETVQKSKIEFTELIDMLLTPNGILSPNHTDQTIAILIESRRQDSRSNIILN